MATGIDRRLGEHVRMTDTGRHRLLTGLIVANLLVTLGVVGWAVWVANDPEYWFPGAFAAEGPVGEEGPRGDRGPRGPAGPSGEPAPDVADAQSAADQAQAAADEAQSLADEAQVQADDLSGRIDNLEGVDTYDLESRSPMWNRGWRKPAALSTSTST